MGILAVVPSTDHRATVNEIDEIRHSRAASADAPAGERCTEWDGAAARETARR